MRVSGRGVVRKLLRLVLLLPLLVLVLGAFGWLSNLSLPRLPADLSHLEPLDKARLAEASRLRTVHGARVWPGWERAELPVRLSNGAYQFLIDHPAPPSDWERVPDDDFERRPYYRRAEPEARPPATPTAGSEDRMWVAGVCVVNVVSKRAMDRLLIRQFARPIPDLVKPFVPYRPLISSTEVYIGSIINGMMQSYLTSLRPQRAAAARLAFENIGGYPFLHPAQVRHWPTEVAALIAAVEEPSAVASRTAARRFLQAREERRADAALDAWSVHLEQQSEWLKGIGLYAELTVWRLASQSQGSEALAEVDPDFGGYAGYPKRWSEILRVTRSCSERPCPMRFQYTGMLQAVLLDRHMPDWRSRAIEADTTLESLVAQLVAGSE